MRSPPPRSPPHSTSHCSALGTFNASLAVECFAAGVSTASWTPSCDSSESAVRHSSTPIRFVRRCLVPPESGVRCATQSTSQDRCRAFRRLESPGATERSVPGIVPGTLVPREVSIRDPGDAGRFLVRPIPPVDRRASKVPVIVLGFAARSAITSVHSAILEQDQTSPMLQAGSSPQCSETDREPIR